MGLPIFNVVKSGFCTCPQKYNLNPYLGRCMHGCIYCYAVKFPSFRGSVVPRIRLKKDIVKMVERTKKRLPVMLSDTTDPYLPLEAKYELTRRCIEVLAKKGFPLLIVTKSDLVTRDIDIFKQTRTVVTMTITTLDEDIARMIEPKAPSPEARFAALGKIVDAGIPTAVRIDPIIPTVNSQERELEAIIAKAAETGVKQITSSTMKIVRGLSPMLKMERPNLFKRLTESYADGEWIAGYKYLNKEKRLKILKNLRTLVLKYGLEFATCREGFPNLDTVICDGTSWYRVFSGLH